MICDVAEAGVLERRADGADAPVHHVGGRDDVAAGFAPGPGLLGPAPRRSASLTISPSLQQPVMAVAGIGIERHIAHDADLRHRLLDGAHRPADQIVGIERLAAVVVCAAPASVYGKDAMAGMPSAAASSAAVHRLDRSTAARRRASRRPARAARRPRSRRSARSGRRRSGWFRATRRRDQSARRLRRSRGRGIARHGHFPGLHAGGG